MTYNRLHRLTLWQVSVGFLSSGGVTLWALLAPEFGGDLNLGRTNHTIWATTFLLLPSLALYLFRTAGQATANLSFLLWIGAWVVFMLHAWWAVYVIFDGPVDTFQKMGTLISIGNFLLTAVWTVDVLALLLVPSRIDLQKLQYVARGLAFTVFAVTLVALRGGPVQVLGFVFVGVLIAAVLARLIVHVSEATEEVAP